MCDLTTGHRNRMKIRRNKEEIWPNKFLQRGHKIVCAFYDTWTAKLGVKEK
jgi:hypothetical protein